MEAVNASSGFLTIRFSLLEHLAHWYSSPVRNGFQCTLASYNIKTKTKFPILTLTGKLYYSRKEPNSFHGNCKTKHVNSGVIFLLSHIPASSIIVESNLFWIIEINGKHVTETASQKSTVFLHLQTSY